VKWQSVHAAASHPSVISRDNSLEFQISYNFEASQQGPSWGGRSDQINKCCLNPIVVVVVVVATAQVLKNKNGVFPDWLRNDSSIPADRGLVAGVAGVVCFG
jgi:hypothetical protein